MVGKEVSPLVKEMSKFQIFIIDLSGKTFAVDVTEKTTGRELKEIYCDRKGVEPSRGLRMLRMIYAGRDIEDSMPLVKRKVQKESTVHCVMRMLSCGASGCPGCQEHQVMAHGPVPEPEREMVQVEVVIIEGWVFVKI